EALAKAATLLKKQIEGDPKNGRLHAQYADALLWSRRLAPAEAPALKAVRLAPNDWRCWRTLGSLRYYQMGLALYGAEERIPWKELYCPNQLMAQLLATPPEQERIEQAETRFVEAGRCLDRAIALAPEEPDVYRERYGFQMAGIFWHVGFTALRGGTPPELIHQLSKTDLLRDARKLAELRPDDPEIQANLAALCLMDALAKKATEAPEEAPKDHKYGLEVVAEMRKAIPAETIKDIEEVLTKLEKLALSKNKAIVEAACRNAAWWCLFLCAVDKAEAHARRAV